MKKSSVNPLFLLLALILIAIFAAIYFSKNRVKKIKSGVTLATIVRPDMIDAQISYVESLIGPAFKINESGSLRIYRIGDCELAVGISAKNEIASFGIELGEKCKFDLKAFLGNDPLPPLNQLTFGDFDGVSFYADCLYMCGNAKDPTVYGFIGGYQANDNLDAILEAHLVTDESIDAANKWEKAMMKKEGEEYVINGTFNCDGKYNEVANSAFRKVRISSISVGRLSQPMFYECADYRNDHELSPDDLDPVRRP